MFYCRKTRTHWNSMSTIDSHLFCFHLLLLPHRNKMEWLWFNCVYFGIDLGVMLYVRNFMTLLSCSCRECSPKKKSIYPMANKMFTLALFVSVGETHWHVQTHTHTDKHLLGEYWFGRCDYYRSRCGKKREGKSFIHGLGHRKGLCGNLWNLFGFSSNEKWKLDFDFLGSFVNVMRRLGFWYAYTYIQFSDESINLFGQLICSLIQIQRLKRVKNRKKKEKDSMHHDPMIIVTI